MGQHWISLLFFAAALVGCAALAAQGAVVAWWSSRKKSSRSSDLGVTILKPLCGVDDDLEKNLESLRAQSHRNYEVLLGVKNEKDAAYPLAKKFAQQSPEIFRVVLQRGEPGMNPKVNQLITLAQHAKHELLFISDSNVLLQPSFVSELAAEFEDEELACLTHPIVGIGERTLGATLESLHLASSTGSGMISAPAVSNQYLVVGKSMCLRRSALEAIGGFEAYSDHLAEDYVIGQAIQQHGLKIKVGALPCQNVSGKKTVKQFWARYARWSVIHATAVSRVTYFGQALLNPIPLAMIGFLVLPRLETLVLALAIAAFKCAVDLYAVKLLRPAPISISTALLVPVKDFILFAAWVRGLFVRTVDWRGNLLRVGEGSRLLRDEPEVDIELELEPVAASGR